MIYMSKLVCLQSDQDQVKSRMTDLARSLCQIWRLSLVTQNKSKSNLHQAKPCFVVWLTYSARTNGDFSVPFHGEKDQHLQKRSTLRVQLSSFVTWGIRKTSKAFKASADPAHGVYLHVEMSL